MKKLTIEEIQEFNPNTPIHEIYEWHYRKMAISGMAGDLRIVAKESSDEKK